MVSTAKSRKLVARVSSANFYKNKLCQITERLKGELDQTQSPYLRQEKRVKKSALIVVSTNRGLCGGYNANLLRMSHEHYKKIESNENKCDLYVIGKKGISFYKFLHIPIFKTYTHIDDNLTQIEAERMSLSFMGKFTKKDYDRIDIASTVYYSAGNQKPAILPFLPLQLDSIAQTKLNEKGDHALDLNCIVEPSPKEVIYELIPLFLKTVFYSAFLASLASEQIARRIAMKNATDAGEEMLKSLTRSYNRIRQASITQELAEIVAGADAI